MQCLLAGQSTGENVGRGGVAGRGLQSGRQTVRHARIGAGRPGSPVGHQPSPVQPSNLFRKKFAVRGEGERPHLQGATGHYWSAQGSLPSPDWVSNQARPNLFAEPARTRTRLSSVSSCLGPGPGPAHWTVQPCCAARGLRPRPGRRAVQSNPSTGQWCSMAGVNCSSSRVTVGPARGGGPQFPLSTYLAAR